MGEVAQCKVPDTERMLFLNVPRHTLVVNCPPDGDAGLLVGIVEAFQAHAGQTDKGFPVFAERKADGKLALDGPLDGDGFGIARHTDRRFPIFESDSTCQ